MNYKIQAPFFLIACYILSTISNVAAHKIGLIQKSLSSWQILSCYSTCGAILSFTYLIFFDRSLLKPKNPGLLLIRGSIGAVANMLWIKSIIGLPISYVILLSTASIFVTYLGGVFFFEKKIKMQRLAACMTGGIGLLISIKAWSSYPPHLLIMPALASLGFSTSTLMTKKIVQSDHIMTTLFYLLVIMSFCSFIFAASSWQPINFEIKGLLLVMAVAYLFSQLFFTAAYRYGDVTYLAPIKFIKYPLNTLADIILFHQVISQQTMFGFMIVILSVWWLLRYENK